MADQKRCPVCHSILKGFSEEIDYFMFYTCPVCGRFELHEDDLEDESINFNQLASYLAYHRCEPGKAGKLAHRYHTTRDKEYCDLYRQKCDNGDNVHGRPIHMDATIIENWYPKTFAERVDNILLYISQHTKHLGEFWKAGFYELIGVLFVDRLIYDDTIRNPKDERNPSDYVYELNYMLEYLKAQGYIESDTFHKFTHHDILSDTKFSFNITPKAYERVEILLKNTSHGRSVLVAMKFGDETKPLREAIRKGIQDAGYIAIFIDEVQHNDFITPELLKHIRDSKFVVVDLTHQNNGAYFEEGYAMGLNKPVIQLCKESTKLHFDIAQKNTIIWETEEEIPERLKNRILATIE